MLKTSDIKSMAQTLRDMKYPPVKEDTDKDEPGTQGDKEEYQKKRKEIANKFGVESCSALKDEEKRKACYAALDAAHVSDDEEEDEDDDPVGKNEEVEIDEKFAGWIAMYGGKKLEIKKSEADGIWPAKQLAIKHFKVPKSKQGLLAIKPAHEEVEVDEHKMGASDTTDMYALMVKGMKQVPGSPKQKETIKQINVIRKRIGLKPMKEDVDLSEETELDESLALQLKMAFSDAKIKMKSRGGKIVIAKRDKKKAMDTLTKVLPSRLKKYVDKAVGNFLVFEEVIGEEMNPTDHVKQDKETGMYCVYDKDGKKVKEFKDKKDADKYAIDNHDALMHREEVETEASTYRDKKYAKKKTGKVPPSQKASRWGQGGYGKEEVKIDEYGKIYARKGSDYELYHKTFSSAMQHAYAHAKKKGFTVDPKEIDNKVATGPKKPSSGKTNRYILGTDKRKKVHIQVANLDNKRYELNMYIESTINQSALDKVRGMIKEKYVTQDKFFPKVLMDGLKKAIPGVKMARFSIKHPRSGQNIPGLGLQLSGDKGIRVMIQYDREDAPAPKGMPDKIVDIDPETGKKEVTDTSFRDSYAVWVNDVGKIWKPNEARWIQTKDFRDPKKVVQFLKTKVKRMAKEEVELDEGKLSYHKKMFAQHREYAHRHDTEQLQADDDGAEQEHMNDHSDGEDAHAEAAEMHQKVIDSIKKRGEKDKETKKLAKMAYKSSKEALDLDIEWRYSGNLKPANKFMRLQREEVEIQEHCGECEMGIEELREVTPKQMSQADKLKMWNKLKSGGTIKLWFNSSMSKGSQWREFKIGRKSKSAKHNLEKISMNLVDRPGGVKYYLYNRKGMISLAIGDMGASLISMKEGIDIEKASMGAVIKDFQNSDAPQFKGKSDKKRREMAIAAKLSKEGTEEVEEAVKYDERKMKKLARKDGMIAKMMKSASAKSVFNSEVLGDSEMERKYQKEEDDPKSKKKDKINLKPKMEDKQMKKLRELQAGLREKRAQVGTLKKTVSDYHKEEVVKEGPNWSMDDLKKIDRMKAALRSAERNPKDPNFGDEDWVDHMKDRIRAAQEKLRSKKEEVKEAVLDNGLEVGEQEWDLEMRKENLYPNLDVNFAKYMDEGLEGPYEISGEVYFYDRKVQMFYSVSGEDYVDEETAKEIAYRLHKDGFYKPELGR